MRNNLDLPFAIGACGIILLVAGCNRGSKLPPTAVVTGRVTVDGKPLSNGTVTFVPNFNKGTHGPAGVGQIDKDGCYRITTAREDGALVGWHLVRICAIDRSSPSGRWLIPPEYDVAEESGLVAEVKAGEDNTIDFSLTWKRQ